MLSKELALYTSRRGRAYPDCLKRATHACYLDYAEQLLTIYRNGRGKTREQLHRTAETVFRDEPDCPPQRIRAFLRLLDQASEYQTDIDGRAYRLRGRVFELAARQHPLVATPDALFQNAEREVKQAIAAELGTIWPRIERVMYADLPECHRLKKMEGFATPEHLLRRYNVAQAQTLLFWAEEMTVMARADFKRIFRHAKFNRLLHEVEAVGPLKSPRAEASGPAPTTCRITHIHRQDAGATHEASGPAPTTCRITHIHRQDAGATHEASGPAPTTCRIRFSGPASILKHTRRYGVDMAKFLPGLLACRGWEMSARLRLPHGIATFALSPRDGLRSDLPEDQEFDSEVEKAFAEKFGAERDGWWLSREGGFLVRGQKVFVPDFTFHHTDGTEVHLELVGFWTPEYLEKKRQTLAMFADTPIIVAVAASVADRLVDLPVSMITYRTRLKIKPVLELLHNLRTK
ncbi:MAG: DUF790 family protein [Phycisphaerae bacterium]|nr:DUF790 family protein [Phycisphaerae bacterium]